MGFGGGARYKRRRLRCTVHRERRRTNKLWWWRRRKKKLWRWRRRKVWRRRRRLRGGESGERRRKFKEEDLYGMGGKVGVQGKVWGRKSRRCNFQSVWRREGVTYMERRSGWSGYRSGDTRNV